MVPDQSNECNVDEWQCKSPDTAKCDRFKVHNVRCIHALVQAPKCVEFVCQHYVCLKNSSIDGQCLKTECKEFICNKYSRNLGKINNSKENGCKELEAKGLKFNNENTDGKGPKPFKLTDYTCRESFNPNEVQGIPEDGCLKFEGERFECLDDSTLASKNMGMIANDDVDTMYPKCINQSKVCDGTPDCQDKEDEDKALCGQPCDEFTEFSCKWYNVSSPKLSPKCINIDKKCNNFPDCSDGSDEEQCDECGNDEWRCSEYQPLGPLKKQCRAFEAMSYNCTDDKKPTDCDSFICKDYNCTEFYPSRNNDNSQNTSKLCKKFECTKFEC